MKRGGAYDPVLLTGESRQGLERDKREFLSIEDIKVGDGPLAAWGRKIRADIEVRYTDGTVERDLVTSGLLVHGRQDNDRVGVRGEKLIIEATLTASCIPVLLRVPGPGSGYFIEREIRCRDADLPQRDPSDPLWHLY